MGLFSRKKKRMTFFGITPENMPHLVNTYVAKLETEESADWCICLWRIHPDDQRVKGRCCRECNQPKSAAVHHDIGGDDYHHFRGIRRVRVDTHLECPVHTKEGLIIGFVKWLANNG